MKPAHAAITAAKKVKAWGLYAAMRYAMKHGATFAQFHIAERFERRRNDWMNWATESEVAAACERARNKNAFRGYLA